MINKIILVMLSGITVSALFLRAGIGGYMKNASAEMNTRDVSSVEWEKIAAKKIYFGHQSVGYNIMTGVSELARDSGARAINIKETKDSNDFNQPIFAHSPVGKNHDPISKINDFKLVIDDGLGDKVDIAFFKFCYVYIYQSTDIKVLFDHYVIAMDDLGLRYKKIKFSHFTIPVKVKPAGIKANIKKLMGMTISGEEDNLKRNDFNRMLKEKYGSTGRVFDLAGHEATYMDGSINVTKTNGRDNIFLIPEYSDDGRHLNYIGSKIVGGHLLKFLASLSE